MATQPPPSRGPHVRGRGGPNVSATRHYPGREDPRRGGGGGGAVNKALYTCTSWYAYAAMFGSSFVRFSKILRTSVCTICQTGPKLHLHLAVFCCPSLHLTLLCTARL